ncbi:hypothetical protein TIFTF001_038289 [Ficus carica]|uniref:Uncharacterized protein n=1 Tax=Ficus carica TaxID=3494 RepID=A0AA88E6Z6_FICCA|nr:hypothetical protein TIFTF001_038279 [Ficus carica]GMN69232.1 hypothetical protein TIFTF001_038282 [Ficus carica]GMN69234.1 hypothetical protein TIFTF001_038286 [Ficus carica]GMN69239.1 hypothetical protein TIFTF001_038289 [Ficus carica]
MRAPLQPVIQAHEISGLLRPPIQQPKPARSQLPPQLFPPRAPAQARVISGPCSQPSSQLQTTPSPPAIPSSLAA